MENLKEPTINSKIHEESRSKTKLFDIEKFQDKIEEWEILKDKCNLLERQREEWEKIIQHYKKEISKSDI